MSGKRHKKEHIQLKKPVSIGTYRFTPTHKMVSGLRSLSVHSSKKYNKVIVLMGEIHNKEGICDSNTQISSNIHTDAVDFLISMLTSINESNGYGDLYIENPYSPFSSERFMNRYQRPGGGFLEETILMLSRMGCIRTSSTSHFSGCILLKNIRVHSCDVRGLDMDDNVLNPISYLMILFRLFIDMYGDDETELEQLYTLIERFNSDPNSITRKLEGSDNNSDFTSYAFEFVQKELKIAKQLVHIPHEEIRDVLLDDHLFSTFSELIDRDVLLRPDAITKFIKDMRPILKTSPVNEEALRPYAVIYDKTFNSICNTLTAIMDVYLMARVFRTFSGSVTPKNIVVYAGDTHIENYRVILDKCGFDTIDHRDTKNNTGDKSLCLDIDNITVEWIGE